jgi:hypothetical protein
VADWAVTDAVYSPCVIVVASVPEGSLPGDAVVAAHGESRSAVGQDCYELCSHGMRRLDDGGNDAAAAAGGGVGKNIAAV